jgi:hypothetical protein
MTVRAAKEVELGVSSKAQKGPEEDRGLPHCHGRGESRDSGATDPSERGTSEVRAAQARGDDWSERLGAHESIPLQWMGGPGSCGEQEVRAAGQVAHPHGSAEGAEDMLERVQDSQQAWRSKMEDYHIAMGVASPEILEPQTRLSMGRQSRAGRT